MRNVLAVVVIFDFLLKRVIYKQVEIIKIETLAIYYVIRRYATISRKVMIDISDNHAMADTDYVSNITEGVIETVKKLEKGIYLFFHVFRL